MADGYNQAVVRLVISQICKSVGWDSINSSALEVLVDFTERHITQIGRRSRRYGEQFGRLDPTIDDLEMVFTDAGINLKEMYDYTKNAEHLSLAQPVSSYPAESEAKIELLVPEIDEDGKIVAIPSALVAIKTEATAQGNSAVDSPDPGSKPSLHTSPVKSSQRSISMTEGSENAKFRMRSQLMMEDGEISSLFNQGKAPRAGRPPKLLHEINIPKLEVEATIKSKIKTGILKPKPKAPVVVDVPEAVIKEEIPITVESKNEEPIPVEKKREKHKPPKKVENKKKKKKAVTSTQPEGFADIFGAPLEKPQTKLKPVKPEKFAGKGSDVSSSRVSSSASQHKEDVKMDSEGSTRAVTPESGVDEMNPDVKARLSNWDDTIDSVLAKSSAAEDAFSFDDRPATPVEQVKASLRSPSKKSKSPGRSKRGAGAIAEADKGQSVTPPPPVKLSEREENKPEISPTGNKTGKNKDKKDKKKKSRREQLLEKFAAAPITSFPTEELGIPKSSSNDQLRHSMPFQDSSTPPVPSDFSRDDSVSEPEPSIVSETVKSTVYDDDDEGELVNVDEDSDVDILHASSPTPPPQTPPPQNPYSAYASTGYEESNHPPTPPLHEPLTESPQLSAYEQPLSRLSGESGDPQWKVYPPEEPQQDANWSSWATANSQIIDFGAASHSDTEVAKKEKHKKEKKEKKEKKKKKHKEKDKDRDKERKPEDGGGKHKHRKGSFSLQTEAPGEEEYAEETVPRITLKLGAQALEADSGPSDLDTSYSAPAAADEVLSPELVPRLVIKPIRVDIEDPYDECIYPPTAGFAPDIAQQPFPVTTDYSNNEPPPVPDEDGKIWICPACGKPDDGSPMIGCDGCDEWYHWPCVAIHSVPPEDVNWYCPTCANTKKKKKKRKREQR